MVEEPLPCITLALMEVNGRQMSMKEAQARVASYQGTKLEDVKLQYAT